MAKADIWHFERKELAEKFIEYLNDSLTNRLTLIAPRRKGKTEFLLFDLAPAAEGAGFDVIYASLWANIDAPHKAVLEALQAADVAKRKKQSITRKVLTTAVNKLKVDALGVGAELEFADKPEIAGGDDMAKIDALITKLSRGRKTKLLLLIDEIQHLGTDKSFMPMTYALRTTLDKLKSVAVVYSGSSRSGIQRMFHHKGQPFFESTTDVDLPDLKKGFVEFMARTFLDVTKRKVSPRSLWTQFKRLDYSPYYVREALKQIAVEPRLGIKIAVDRVIEAVALRNDYEGLWERLNPLDKLLIRRIANGAGKSLHTEESLKTFQGELKGGRKVTRTLVGKRLQRMSEMSLVSSTDRGVYQLELPGFSEWIRTQEKD